MENAITMMLLAISMTLVFLWIDKKIKFRYVILGWIIQISWMVMAMIQAVVI